MGTPAGQRLGESSRRNIFVAAAAYYVFFTVFGSAAALTGPLPLRGAAFNALTNAINVVLNLAISRQLDRTRERMGRDPWPLAVLLAVLAAVITEPLLASVARLPFLSATLHPQIISLSDLIECFLLYLFWAAVHFMVRSSERALAQERCIAETQQRLLGDEQKALLYALDPGFLLDALIRIARSLQGRAPRVAGEMVIVLAEHMRVTLADRPASENKESENKEHVGWDAAVEANPPSSLSVGAYDERRERRRFQYRSGVAWAGLLALVLLLAGLDGGLRIVIRFGPQPLISALWCAVVDGRLARRASSSLKRLYSEAALLCVIGVAISTTVLLACDAALGMLSRSDAAVGIGEFEVFYAAPALLAWTAGWLILDARRREVARLRAAAEIQEAALKARNAVLRQQVNPHFLFNALNALYALILDGEREKALGVIGAIQRFVERAGDPAHGDFVALSSELATQDAYLDIERVRFGDRLLVERSVAPELEAAKVPHLILQPLVENAVKYAVSRTDAPVRVEISAARSGEELVLQVKDTGAPEAAPRPPGLGVGLKNVESRLKSLYGDAGRLACRSLSPSGFLAEVRMPLVL